MKKKICFLALWLISLSTAPASGQIVVANIIKAGVKKIIKAVDLEVQRLQNQTIALQNAQKELENTMAALRLREISAWAKKQKDLYQTYYDELWEVKNIIRYYDRVKDIGETEIKLTSAYRDAWSRLKRDPRFTAAELAYMGNVYKGILDQAARNAHRLLGVVQAFTTEMSDADRLRMIDQIAAQAEEQYDDFRRFTTQNELLSISRAKDRSELETIKRVYGIY